VHNPDEVFVPHHINATPEDLAGNGGIGRYILLPGSDGRAAQIAELFEDVTVKTHPRHHNLYMGTLRHAGRAIDVAVISTGMGCASLDIIVNELFQLGGKRFLRVGTAGSLQPNRIRVGAVVVATASVRDEHTSRVYVPVEVPAVASLEFVMAARQAAAALGRKAHFGTVHCKDSLYAREFGEGPMARQNREYMELLINSGTLASEMESSQLFVLASLFNHRLLQRGEGPLNRVVAGAILGVVGDDRPFASPEEGQAAVDGSIALAIETIRQLAASEAPPVLVAEVEPAEAPRPVA
jgi:uridine phosphorylase